MFKPRSDWDRNSNMGFMTRRKTVGDSTEPCLTPLFKLKYSDVSPPVCTQLRVLTNLHAVDSCMKEMLQKDAVLYHVKSLLEVVHACIDPVFEVFVFLQGVCMW